MDFQYQLYLNMKMKIKAVLLLLALLITQIVAEQERHETLELDKPYQKELTAQTMFTGKYIFQIPQSAVKQMKGDKWFFFVQVEPNEENEWVSTSIEISIGKKGSQQSKNTRTCASRKGGVDSCFYTNKQFDYKTEEIHAKVRCRGICKFKISGEISQPYKLQPGESIEMDFQNTAYSKVFILNTTGDRSFDQLRITLKPKGFLQFPAPIGLYVNKGTTLPTRKQNDFQSLTLWDNGEGVFIDAPDAQNVFTILVQSPQKNLLVLSTQLIHFKESVDIPQTLPYFDYLGEGSSRLYRAKVNPEKGVNIKLATFSGAIQLAEIYDAEKVAITDTFPKIYRSFSQMEYQIPAEFFNTNRKKYQIDQYIIFKVEGIKESTYLVQAYEINKGIVHLVPQLNRYVDLGSKSINQYYIDVVEPVRPQFKKSQIEVVIMHEETKGLKVRFFKCIKDHGRSCEIKKSLLKDENIQTQQFKQVQAMVEQHFGSSTNYKFTLYNKEFERVANNSDVKHYIMTVVVENQYSDSQDYTIRYTNPGRNIYLKQKESQKDRISIDEVKHYVFTNRHEDVQQIRVHLVEISGRVHIEGFKGDPRKSNLEGQEIIDFRNTLRFTNVKLNQTIFVRVTGKEAAYYSLQVQLVKESERQWWNRNKTQGNKTKGYNQVVIFEDIPYEFSLQPNQKAVYQIHTKKSQFILEMSSLLPLQVCMTQELTKPPFEPNCQEKDKLFKKQVLEVKMDRGKIANIGVTNNNQRSNKFSIKFSSIKQGQNPVIPVQPGADNYTVAKCLPALLGKTTKYSIQQKTQTCYTYFVPKAENLELTVDIVSREYDKVNILAALGSERVAFTSSQHIFKKQQVLKACNNTFPCTMKIFIQSEVKTQLRFSVQYLDGTVFLLDGIANTFSASNNKRYFAYELYNKINTTVILQNKNGFYKFYGSIVEASQYWKSKDQQKNLFPTLSNNNFKSANPFYYSYQIAIVTEKQIKDAKCTECLLLLTVQKEKETHLDEAGYFTIECTQEDRFLKPNSPVATFLGKNSFAFYELYNQNEGTLVVSLNSQNQECAKIYVKKGESRASGNQNDGTTSQNTLILQKAEKGNYAVTVEAIDDCYYSIEYSTTQSKIYSTLQQGYLIDIRLEKSQSQKLLYHHTKNQSFRILTLHQAGEVSINARTYKDIKSFVNDNTTRTRFLWSGKDFLRIQKDSYKFCSDCYYLIELRAERQTKTSVIIPTEGSQFPIMMDSTIKQELKKGQYETIRVFTQRIVQFQINVQYGMVNISLLSKDKDQLIFTKVYSADQATKYETINNTKNNSGRPDIGYYFAEFSRVIIRAQQDSGFSFGLISDIDVSKRGSRVKYGIPEYLSLEKGKSQCLVGRIDSADQQFLISITGDQSQSLMNNLQISCQTKNKQLLQLGKDIAKNQMIVKIQRPPKKIPVDYQFCMTSKENVFLTFIQSASLVYLPQNTPMVVQKSMNFSFYSEGKNVLEINECKSRAVTTILNSFTTSDKANSEIKQVRKSNNLIQFLFYGPVYININTTSGTIAWRRKDELKKIGYGYDEYSPNKLRYSINGNTLRVVIYGVKRNGNIAKPMVDFGQSNYTAFIAQQEMNLYDAINCANGTYLQQSYKSREPQDEVTVQFNIKEIVEKFRGKRYLLVGALVVASSKTEGDGKYRFLYPYQQIPISALTGEKIQEVKPYPNPRPTPGEVEQRSDIKHEQPWEILLYILIALLIIAGAVYLYRKFLRKFLKKRRMQRLSEQGTGEVRYQEFANQS